MLDHMSSAFSAISVIFVAMEEDEEVEEDEAEEEEEDEAEEDDELNDESVFGLAGVCSVM